MRMRQSPGLFALGVATGVFLPLWGCSGDAGSGDFFIDGGADSGATPGMDSGAVGRTDGGNHPPEGGVGPVDTGTWTPPGDDGGTQGDGAAPPAFWGDPTTIPPAQNALMFKFLNRTNGKFTDGEVYWSFKSGAINETHSIAEQSTYDMPANNSGRMYFYVCGAANGCTGDPTKSQYYDFIEFTIGAAQYNGNTTRVDAFGLKIANRLHCADGFDGAFGEDYETFAEDRTVTFQKFLSEAPAEFQPCAQPPHAPYRIVEPGACGFNAGGMYATYYDSFINTIWANNGLTIPKPGPNASGLGAYPNISAAIYRHVGDTAGTFSPDGKLMNNSLWKDSTTFYTSAPADYYARFWHAHGLNGKAYGFPYDDVGGYSSYVSHSNPQYMIVAIGW
jgi:hypothetical protein